MWVDLVRMSPLLLNFGFCYTPDTQKQHLPHITVGVPYEVLKVNIKSKTKADQSNEKKGGAPGRVPQVSYLYKSPIFRQLNTLVAYGGRPGLARLIPDFMRIPHWLVHWGSYKF